MHYKILIFTSVIFLVLAVGGCSTLEKVVYCHNINQGNYFTPNDISKVRIGMTQQQVTYILGTPMMSDPFGTNTWFYICLQQKGRKDTIQQNLILTFNEENILINVDNKPILIKQ